VAATANLRGNFEPRPRGRIVGVGSVVARGAVTILALHAFQLGRSRRAGEPSRFTVADGVTGQAGGIFVLMTLLQARERLRVQGAHDGVVNLLVALEAGLRTDIVRSGAQDSEQSVRTGACHERAAREVGSGTNGFPRRVGQALLLKELIIARRAIPRDGAAIGGGKDTGKDRLARNAAGLSNAEVLNALGAAGRRTSEQDHKNQEERDRRAVGMSGPIHSR
jgi:hypothetical protein